MDYSKHALIEITKQCCYSCLHCFTNACRSTREAIPSSQYKRMFAQLAKSGVTEVTISGGEPLLKTDWSDILVFAKEAGLTVNLFTTGMGHTKLDFAKLRDLCSVVAISIDFNRDHHNEIRGNKEAYDSILNFLEKLRDNEINVFVQTMVTARNINLMQEYSRFINDRSIESFSLTHVSRQGVAERGSPWLFLENPEIRYLWDVVSAFRTGKYDVHTNLQSTAMLLENRRSFLKANLHITPDGVVLPYYGVPDKWKLCKFPEEDIDAILTEQDSPAIVAADDLLSRSFAKATEREDGIVSFEDIVYQTSCGQECNGYEYGE